MSSDRFQLVATIFDAASELPADKRADYLDEVCAEDVEMRAEVEALLHSDDSLPDCLSDEHLEQQANLRVTEAIGLCAIVQGIPERIAGYRIINIHGEGGMGIVYRAEQDNPNRTVALKVMRAGAVSGSAFRRFQQESDLLARLQHHGIAQVYDAGEADVGFGTQPYFAMEFVDGRPLTAYAVAKELGNHERLRLMLQVCEAIDHAHQRGIIHRDLKPQNILVTASGQPKVLDFGVARATDSDVQTTTLRTDVGQILGTIAYMSPEQVAGDTTNIDARSDVYALGVIMFELMTGVLPHELKGRPIHEAARIITEVDPTKLSSFSRVFRGDLATIMDRTLAKDPAQRYQTAAALGADLERYLNREPIVARSPSAVYRTGKFVNRHRLPTTLVAIIVALIGVSGWLVIRGTGSEPVASEEDSEKAGGDLVVQGDVGGDEAVPPESTQESSIAAADPGQDQQRPVRPPLRPGIDRPRGGVSRIYDRVVGWIERGELAEHEAGLRDQLQRNVRPRQSLPLRHELAVLLVVSEDWDAAEAFNRESIDFARQMTESDDSPPVMMHRALLGWALVGLDRTDEADTEFEAILSRGPSLGPEQLHDARVGRGRCLIETDDFGPAESLLLRGYEGLAQGAGDNDFRTRRAVETLVMLYEAWGRDDAVAQYRALLEDDGR